MIDSCNVVAQEFTFVLGEFFTSNRACVGPEGYSSDCKVTYCFLRSRSLSFVRKGLLSSRMSH